METIDEIIPLTESDVAILKSRQFTGTWGCSLICFAGVLILAFIGYLYFLDSYLILAILAVCSALLLLLGISFLKAKKFENHAVTQDLAEGKKRRIVAPIDEKDIVDVTRRPHPLNIKKQIIKADQELKLEYYMMVHGFKFLITENQYLSGARKGDFMEFSVAPNSKIILSEPTEFRE